MDAPRTSRRRTAALTLATAIALLLPAAAPAPAAAACANRDAHPSDVGVAKIKSATLCLLNKQRSSRGRGKLRANRRLARAARAHALDMVRRDYFAHTTPTGVNFVDRILDADYVGPRDGWTLGENLAWGSQQLATPRLIVRAWMHSPGHRANILKRRFREIGIGVVHGAPEPGVTRAATYATEFGTRL
jgi:uncharacterized protein YkwD